LSVPPTYSTNMSNHMRYLVFLIALSAVIGSCSQNPSMSREPVSDTSSTNGKPASPEPPTAESTSQALPSPEPCQQAPDWLVTRLAQGLLVRGSSLSEVYIGVASDFTSGPAVVLTAEFMPAWWVAAKINGAGIRPEIGLWVAGPIHSGSFGQLFGANAAAQRYTKWGSGSSDPIRGMGSESVLACLAPIPEP